MKAPWRRKTNHISIELAYLLLLEQGSLVVCILLDGHQVLGPIIEGRLEDILLRIQLVGHLLEANRLITGFLGDKAKQLIYTLIEKD